MTQYARVSSRYTQYIKGLQPQMESAIKGVSGEASHDKMQSVLTPALLADLIVNC